MTVNSRKSLIVSGMLNGMQNNSINVITEILIRDTFKRRGDEIYFGLYIRFIIYDILRRELIFD